jgi:hypothetical protein
MTDAAALQEFFAKPRTLVDEIRRSHPSLERGRVWCTRCDKWKDVDVGKCLTEGWPRCHGATMSIDSPKERETARKARDRDTCRNG